MALSSSEVDPAHVAAGRRYLQWALAFLVLASVTVTALYVVRIGFGNFPQQVVRLVLLLVIGHFLLRGRAWARWLLLALLLWGVWVSLPIVLQTDTYRPENLPARLPLLVMFVGYVFVVRGLMYSRSVQAFFRAHREPSAPVAASQPNSEPTDG